MDCVEKAAAWIKTHDLIPKGSRVLAAVSGGPDSMAMLTILSELSGSLGLTLAAAHFDHRIRPASARDRDTTAAYCSRLGLQLFTGSDDVPAAAGKAGVGIEEAAREMRYRFLEETAAAWRADAVALGHNRDDQVETVIHHFIRGSGWRGLTGMPASRGIFVRPVLCLGRDEIIAFVRSRKIKFAVDSTNRDEKYLRNRIRHRLIPYLRRNFNPSIDDSILRVSENISEGWQALSARTADLVPPAARDGSVSIASGKVLQLSDFEVYLLVDEVLRSRFGIVQDIDKKHFDAAKRLINSSQPGKRVQFPHGVSLIREQRAFRFEKPAGSGRPVPAPSVSIPREGIYELPHWGIVAEFSAVRVPPARIVSTPSEALLGGISFPIRVRPPEPGDRMVPFGMRGRRKLSDIFGSAKIPARLRPSQPVFEDSGGIFWIPGVASGERTRIDEKGAEALKITLSPLRKHSPKR